MIGTDFVALICSRAARTFLILVHTSPHIDCLVKEAARSFFFFFLVHAYKRTYMHAHESFMSQ